jgi:hypothetical protein
MTWINFEGKLSDLRKTSDKSTEPSELTIGKAMDAARKLGKHLKISKPEEGTILYILNGPDSLKEIRREWTEFVANGLTPFFIYCNELSKRARELRKAVEEELVKQSLGFKNKNIEERNTEVVELQGSKWQELLEEAKKPFGEKAAAKKQEVDEFVTYILDEGAREQQDPSNNNQPGSTQTRDKGHAGFRLKDFLELSFKDKNGRFAQYTTLGLEEKHIAALRIYTSPLYWYINVSLRNPQQKSPYPATILLLDEALRLLRQVHAGDRAQERKEYWRGMRNCKIPREFEQCGGTEYACMSTSTEKAIVAEYAKSQTPLIFRVVASSFASSAADISWLSLYPDESEMLFPPLTYLRYIRTLGITDCPNGNVIEVEAILV